MFLSAANILAKFNIQQNAFAGQIEAAIASANLRLRRWVETDVYTEAEGTDLDPSDENYIRQISVIEAHSYLTMWFLYTNVGHRLSSGGFIKQAQDAKSVEGSTITNQYLNPAEVEKKKNEMMEMAQDFISPYSTVVLSADEYSDAPGFETGILSEAYASDCIC